MMLKEYDLVRTLEQALTRARDLDLALGRAVSFTLGHDLARALARDLDRARDLASDLAAPRTFPGGGARGLARDLTEARNAATDLARALADGSALARGRATALAEDLSHDLKRARVIVGLAPQPDGDKALQGRPAVHVAAPAVRLVAGAARLLPAADRPRYREEYHNELWEMAATGAGRRQQLAYAIRQVLRIMPLRFAVLTPRRRGARP
jgi:hypothetical protein